MMIAGLWHGAAWTFVIWGLFQGMFLMADRLWKKTFNLSGRLPVWLKPSWSMVVRFVTLTAMLVSLTLFRVESMESIWTIFTALAGQDVALVEIPAVSVEGFLKVLAILVFTLTAPNIYQFMRNYQPALTASTAPLGRWSSRIVWRPGPLYAVLLGIIAILSMGTPLDFYYFRF
jgi:alginate O-acetyltransferase complex protein AlgI